MRIVISQPMYFPWIGFMSQLAMADVVIWLDDVSFSKGSFTNRIQIKGKSFPDWLSISLHNKGKNQLICELQCADSNIRQIHYSKLYNYFSKCTYRENALSLFEQTWEIDQPLFKTIIKSTEVLMDKFLPRRPTTYLSSALNTTGTGTNRVLELVQKFNGTTYITGHGAKNYLDHEAFEQSGVSVEYMKYGPYSWPQQHGTFNPFVSSLDIIANVGFANCQNHMVLETVDWKDFTNRVQV